MNELDRLQLEHDFLIENIKLDKIDNLFSCHKIAEIVYEALKKKGYDVELKRGVYHYFQKHIIHSWIECEDLVLETASKQLREPEGTPEADVDDMSKEPFAVLSKKQFLDRYQEVNIPKEVADCDGAIRKISVQELHQRLKADREVGHQDD